MKGKTTLVAIASLATLGFLSSGLLHSGFGKIQTHYSKPVEKRDTDFSWGSITPSKELIWHECYEKFQCARLEVPLDYADPEGRKAAIALTRKPALISPKLPFYKGPVLFNPGGPGGSGIDLIRQAGIIFSVILGPLFDIVSFDPRGVGRSTPRASLFNTDAERALFTASSSVPAFNSSDAGIARVWGATQLFGMLAEDRDDGYLAHITTPNTARDMLSIVEAHGQEKLQYWGFSYGSVLGATFAAMFPDKVKRLVIDGVMDAEDYYATGWKSNLLDTDKTFDTFFTSCAEAGPDRCALYSPQPDDIRRNLTRIFDKIKREPIPVKTETSYGLIDLLSIRTAIFVSLYTPRALFSPLADALAKLATGDALPMFKLHTLTSAPRFECSCDSPNDEFKAVTEGTISILCNDGAKVSDKLSDAEDYFRDLSKRSQFADMWASIHMACSRWPNTSASFKKNFEANTSHPILLVGNTADPVTPLASAKKMSAGFTNSVVLTQDSAGHCSISAPSICTQRHISRYFNDGTLPEPGTVCKTIGSNFPPRHHKIMDPDRKQAPLQENDSDAGADFALWDAVEQLSLLYPVHVPSRLL
ncbi:TAP-like protein-domain-containing protein [Coprinopsis sp. MPI-PUGE-AT-0042]|nr:TAP-like protein-domain-containing protein [Coprinopsis sp. MPI-PUGE-AT-0042]